VDLGVHKITAAEFDTSGGGPTLIQTVEGTAPSSPTSPFTGALYQDSADHHAKLKLASGTVIDLGGGGGSGIASYNISSLSISSSPVTVTHNLGTSTPVVALFDHTTGEALIAQIIATGSNTLTITGSVSETVDGIVSTGGVGATGPAGATGATGAAGSAIRAWVISIGDPGTGSPVLTDDNDSPVAVGNSLGADITILSVSCWANAGSPTVTPILTAGTATSILTGALTCGTGSWAAGTVNGTPVLHTFSANGATCASTPCTADVNITTAGGVAKYIVVRIVGTL
jgi:hypothetical protein